MEYPRSVSHDASFNAYGESASAQWVAESEHVDSRRRRPRRSAMERRQQQQRSDARAVTRLLRGLSSIRSHRGNTLSTIGGALLSILEPVSGLPHRDATVRHNMPLCRHFSAGRCTWGQSCRFSHADHEDGPNQRDNDEQQHNGDGHGYHADQHEDYSGTDYNVDNHGEDQHENQSTQHDFDHDDDHEEDGTSQRDNDEQQHNGEGDGDHADHQVDYSRTDYNDDQHGNSDYNDDSQDDVDEIIHVLGALSQDHEAQQHALCTLPPQLLLEVQTRCRQYCDLPHDGSESEEVIDLDSCDIQHDTLDVIADTNAINEQLNAVRHATAMKITNILRAHNCNKKYVRRKLGNKRLHLALSPSARPLGSNIATMAFPNHVGDDDGCHAGTSSASVQPDVPAAQTLSSSADSQHEHEQLSIALLEQVRETLRILPFSQRWDAFVGLPHQIRQVMLNHYPSIMLEREDGDSSDHEHET